MADEWIKLIIHPEHPKILRIAELTGADPEKVFAKVVRWFRYIDQHLASDMTGIGIESFHGIAGWKQAEGHGDRTIRDSRPCRRTLAEALMDDGVGWLAIRDDGTLRVLGFEKHFGQSAKRRAQSSLRQKLSRKRRASVTQKCDKERDSLSHSLSHSHSGSDPPNWPTGLSRPEHWTEGIPSEVIEAVCRVWPRHLLHERDWMDVRRAVLRAGPTALLIELNDAVGKEVGLSEVLGKVNGEAAARGINRAKRIKSDAEREEEEADAKIKQALRQGKT